MDIGLSSNAVLTAPANVDGSFVAPRGLVEVSSRNGILRTTRKLHPSDRVGVRLHYCRGESSIGDILRTRPPKTANFTITRGTVSVCGVVRSITTVNTIPLAPCKAPSAARIPSTVRPCLRSRSIVLLRGRNTLSINDSIVATFCEVRDLRL